MRVSSIPGIGLKRARCPNSRRRLASLSMPALLLVLIVVRDGLSLEPSDWVERP